MVTRKRLLGVAFLAGALVAYLTGEWWLWPGLVGIALYLLVGHIRTNVAGERPRS